MVQREKEFDKEVDADGVVETWERIEMVAAVIETPEIGREGVL